jgi:hypothetical protein
VRGWTISSFGGILARPIGASKRIFVPSRVGFCIPFKKRYHLLDSFAIGVGLAVALVIASAMYQDTIGPNVVASSVDELPSKLAAFRIVLIVSLFLAWLFLAMLARDWQAESINNQPEEHKKC